MTRARDRTSAPSVRARLLERAKREGQEFQRVLVQYANERVLYRLSASRHRDAFVLKGASLFVLWAGQMPRATKDVDLLGVGKPDPERLERVFRDILLTNVEPDGVTFDTESLRASAIREDAVYEGVRVTFAAVLGTARLSLQVDVGFGDAVEPLPESIEYPTLLDAPAPSLRAYRREVVVAEKYHAMVVLGLANSRMKDYFDLAFLAERFVFGGPELVRALRATFERRETPLPVELPVGLNDEFARDGQKRTQWASFVRRVYKPMGQLDETVEKVRAFVWPAALAAATQSDFQARWAAREWRWALRGDL